MAWLPFGRTIQSTPVSIIRARSSCTLRSASRVSAPKKTTGTPSGTRPSATPAVRSRSAVRNSESRTSTAATRIWGPTSSFSKRPLGSLMSRAQRSATTAPISNRASWSSLLITSASAVDRDVAHRAERDLGG